MEVEANNILTVLHKSFITDIISYLEIPDVFTSLILVNKEFYNLILSSTYLYKTLFENLLGRKIPVDWHIENKSIQEKLKIAFQTREKAVMLPFYGFRGNCGADDDKFEYLFDKVFEHREGRDPVCTRIGEDFEIEGVLSENFAQETKLVESLSKVFHNLNTPFSQQAKEILISYGLRSFQPFLHLILNHFPALSQDEGLSQQLEKFQQKKDSFSQYMQTNTKNYMIELEANPMKQVLGLIEYCEINRGLDFLTCPVKTLMAFASLNEEIGMSNPFVFLFNGCKTSNDLHKILDQHKDVLPRIHSTSIKGLDPLAAYYEEDGVEYVTFYSNGMTSDVIPLFWIRFNNETKRQFSLDLMDSNLSGRYVVLKLIECENLMDRFDDDHQESNIDLQSCCFYGQMLHF